MNVSTPVNPIPRRSRKASFPLLILLLSLGATSDTTPEPPIPGGLGTADAIVRTAAAEAIDRVRTSPHGIDAWLRLARFYHANAFAPEALASYSIALSLDANLAPAWHGRALLQQETGRLDEAFADLERALAADPSYYQGHWRRARWLLESGRLDEAIATLDRVESIRPRERATRVLRAETLLAQHRTADALALVEPVARRNDPWAQRVYADALRRSGRPDEARIADARAHGRRRDIPDPWRAATTAMEVGLIPTMSEAGRHAAAGRPDEAVALYEHLHATYPGNATVAVNLAIQYATTGRSGQAHAVLDAAQPEVAGDADRGRLAYGRMIVFMTAGARSQALAAAEQALELNPGFGIVLMEKGRILAAENRHDEALAALAAAANAMPDNGAVMEIKGELERRLGRNADAAASFAAATQREPLRTQSWINLAILEAELGRHDQADRALRMARLVAPGNPAIDMASRAIEAAAGREEE